jgi:uncharacterized membrane protein
MVNETAKRSPWLIALLVVSLGLNLFLGGLMFGRWFSGPSMMRQMAMHGERGAGGEPGRFLTQRMAASLPAEHRPVFEAAMEQHRDRVAQAAAEAREARAMVRDALSREPFDRTALERAFEAVRSRNDALQQEIQAAIADAATNLPPDARQRLADWRAYGRGR